MQTIVITGGSRGIGAAAVEAFSRRGDRVYFLYEKNHEAAAAVAAATGATAICCDVADGDAVRKAFAQIGQLDVLICNAGIVHYGLLQASSIASMPPWARFCAAIGAASSPSAPCGVRWVLPVKPPTPPPRVL